MGLKQREGKVNFIRYWAIRWLPVILAVPLVGMAALLVPEVVLVAFDANAVWTPWVGAGFEAVGEKLIAPHLLPGAWEAISGALDGIRAVYGALVTGIHALATKLPPEYGARTEVFVRGYLVEGWLLVAEVAVVLRLFVARLV